MDDSHYILEQAPWLSGFYQAAQLSRDQTKIVCMTICGNMMVAVAANGLRGKVFMRKGDVALSCSAGSDLSTVWRGDTSRMSRDSREYYSCQSIT